jgi:hypothetical protein
MNSATHHLRASSIVLGFRHSLYHCEWVPVLENIYPIVTGHGCPSSEQPYDVVGPNIFSELSPRIPESNDQVRLIEIAAGRRDLGPIFLKLFRQLKRSLKS